MAAGAVHVPWYATGFRGDQLEEALAELTPLSVRYGATQYAVYRSKDDKYRLLQVMHFESKSDWERFWNSPEFTRFRTVTSGWWQVPVLYTWQDVAVVGEGPKAGADVQEPAPEPEPSPAEA